MDKFMLLIIGLCIVFLGCEASKAPQEYGDAMVKAMDTAQRLKYTHGVQQAIHKYRVEQGKYPESLDEVEGVPELPRNWAWKYNKQNGKATLVKKKK